MNSADIERFKGISLLYESTKSTHHWMTFTWSGGLVNEDTLVAVRGTESTIRGLNALNSKRTWLNPDRCNNTRNIRSTLFRHRFEHNHRYYMNISDYVANKGRTLGVNNELMLFARAYRSVIKLLCRASTLLVTYHEEDETSGDCRGCHYHIICSLPRNVSTNSSTKWFNSSVWRNACKHNNLLIHNTDNTRLTGCTVVNLASAISFLIANGVEYRGSNNALIDAVMLYTCPIIDQAGPIDLTANYCDVDREIDEPDDSDNNIIEYNCNNITVRKRRTLKRSQDSCVTVNGIPLVKCVRVE